MKALEPAKRIQRARVRIAFHILSIILMLKGFTDTLWVIESAIMQSLKKLFDSVLSAALLCFHWNSQDGWNRPLVRALRWEAKLEAEVIPNAWWSAENTIHMVVSIQLKNISQNGNLPQIGVKIKNIWNRHLAIYGSANWPVFLVMRICDHVPVTISGHKGATGLNSFLELSIVDRWTVI